MAAQRTLEQNLITELASQFRQISGIKNAYDFANNPDTLSNAQLPAVLFLPTEFDASLRAHHNRHRNQIVITAVLFVTPRQSMGGKLKFIENAAIPYLGKVRQHFQTESVIKSLFTVGNLTEATSFTGTYGSGGLFLTHNDIEYLGCIFRWQFIEII